MAMPAPMRMKRHASEGTPSHRAHQGGLERHRLKKPGTYVCLLTVRLAACLPASQGVGPKRHRLKPQPSPEPHLSLSLCQDHKNDCLARQPAGPPRPAYFAHDISRSVLTLLFDAVASAPHILEVASAHKRVKQAMSKLGIMYSIPNPTRTRLPVVILSAAVSLHDSGDDKLDRC